MIGAEIDKLKSSVKCKIYLEVDKSCDVYWIIGKYHDSEGVNFAQALYCYFEEQFDHLVRFEQEELITEICNKY
jgi:hypothetical protein